MAGSKRARKFNAQRPMATLIGLALIAALVLLRLGDPQPVAAIRDIGFDALQRAQPRPAAESAVRVVDIDETSLQQFGQWPWPRSLLATLTTRLGELGVAAIGFDVLFAEADRMGGGNDDSFAAALRRQPVALGFSSSPVAPPPDETAKSGFAISGSDPTASLPLLGGAVAPLPLLAAAAAGLGSLSLDSEEAAGMVRRVPLLWTDGTALYPALSIEVLRLALGADTIVALGDTRGDHTLEALRVGGMNVPTAADGALVLYDRPYDPTKVISAAQLLGDDYRRYADDLAGRIVLVGTSASGLLDLHATPVAGNVPGVMVHATVIDQIVAQRFLSRADWVEGLEILGFILAGLLLVGVVLRLGPLAGLGLAVAVIAAQLGGSWWAFAAQGWLLDASFPAAGALLIYGTMVFLQFTLSERNRRQLRRAFGHYVAPALLARIEQSADELKLGGEAREISVMFADMRGFTAFTETHGPAETLSMLNTLLGALGDEIVRRSGTIDKFIGDAIMAFWNAPVDVEAHPRRACEAALAMRGRLEDLNGLHHLPGIAVGIGLATGEALVGNMGLESRFDYSAIGDTVNIASRIEGACRSVGFDIIAAEGTRAAVPDFAWLDAGSVELKGKARRLPIHILVGDADLAQNAAFIELAAAHAALVAGRGEVEICARLVAQVEPRLAEFYALLPGRAADFVSPA
jgi:adenylate cyclase